jgi:hypothetical protein
MYVKQMFISLLAILRDRVKNTIVLYLLCLGFFGFKIESIRRTVKTFFDLEVLSRMTDFNFYIHFFLSKIDLFTPKFDDLVSCNLNKCYIVLNGYNVMVNTLNVCYCLSEIN